MSTISPDGAWRWNGTAWEPNQPSATPWAAPTFAPGQPLPGPLTTSELTSAAWSHYGPLAVACASILLMLTIVGGALAWLAVFAFVIPLYIRANQGRTSSFVLQHATESLNFQLTWLLVSVVLVLVTVFSFGLLGLLTVPVMIGASIFMIVVMAKAGLAAKRGALYRYPLSIRFV